MYLDFIVYNFTINNYISLINYRCAFIGINRQIDKGQPNLRKVNRQEYSYLLWGIVLLKVIIAQTASYSIVKFKFLD